MYCRSSMGRIRDLELFLYGGPEPVFRRGDIGSMLDREEAVTKHLTYQKAIQPKYTIITKNEKYELAYPYL